jgi:hypothetical protein
VVPCLEALEDRALPALAVTGLATAAGAAALAQQLAGPGVTISNVQFTGTVGGATASAGNFTGATAVTGFDSGIILSNGHAVDVVGPSTNFASTDLGLPGDPDLDGLAGVQPSQGFDATILQFDIVPKGPMLTFSYVFGSEEYNEFVGSQFDDVFGFFVNGKNVALIPGTNTPVSVNTVNLGVNSQFYRDNDPADFGGKPGPIPTALNGLTTTLTAQVFVNPGVINHIKLGIEDTGDGVFDSDVFIEAGSFAAPKAPVPIGFKPFRYVFQAATATTPATYNGNVTVINLGNATLAGPLAIALANLPATVTFFNASGTTGGTNGAPVLPALGVPGTPALNPGQITRVFIQLTNPPPPTFLSTFFEGYLVDVLSGTAAQGL